MQDNDGKNEYADIFIESIKVYISLHKVCVKTKRIKFTNKNKLINVKRKTKMASSEVAKNLHPKKKLAQTHGPPISHGTL